MSCIDFEKKVILKEHASFQKKIRNNPPLAGGNGA